ncbi:cyclase family protein [Streptomyces sp. R39]|uniref:Cyclase family protein n=1 Tax=Streptomyces sp. R39 TaxID=3238631 RepID=A0AB39QVF4_9ACTN
MNAADLDSTPDIVDLSHPMEPGMPNFDSAPEYRLIPNYRLGDFELEGGYWGCNEYISMSGHSGTHVDALGHVAQDGLVHGGIDALRAQSGVRGLVSHSVDDIAPIVRRGVLLDVAGHQGTDVLEAAAPISADVIREVLAASGTDLRDGDCVLVRTGWQRYWSQPQAYLGAATGLPGITEDALHWMADRGVHLVGSDTGVVEATRPGELYLPVHMAALVQRGVYLLENAALDGLVGRPPTFQLVVAPLRLRGSSGSPVRPLALFTR